MITKKAISLCLSCYLASIQHVWLVLLHGVWDYSWNTGRLGTGIVGIAFIHISVIWSLIQGLPGGLPGADYRKFTYGLSAWDSLKHGGWVERERIIRQSCFHGLALAVTQHHFSPIPLFEAGMNFCPDSRGLPVTL